MKKIIFNLLLVAMLCLLFTVPAFAEGNHPARVVDQANLLSSTEEKELTAKINEISERQKFDIVVVTVNSLEGKTPEAFADDFFDYNGYGYGANFDGTLFLVSMEERDYHISTCGFGITSITDQGLEYMTDEFKPYLSSGEYARAFTTFATLCDDFVTQAKTGNPYDVGNMPKGVFQVGKTIGYSLIIGFILALIITLIMKSQLKSVRPQAAATSYTKEGSLYIRQQQDNFRYANTTRTAKPKESSGGSSTHTSSSGRSHGGGGGKF